MRKKYEIDVHVIRPNKNRGNLRLGELTTGSRQPGPRSRMHVYRIIRNKACRFLVTSSETSLLRLFDETPIDFDLLVENS